MEEKKTTALGSGMIWFGAAISIAELLTGTAIAPLGFARGIAAILLGHAIGCVLLYFTGLIGARTGLGAMETTRISFGRIGAAFFAVLNVLQLVGWTAVMTRQGADSAAAAAGYLGIFDSIDTWALVIGAFILLWIVVGVANLEKINAVVITLLFAMTLVLSFVVFRSGGAAAADSGDTLSFGAAVELSAAMPVSWLPVISDYTRTAARPRLATATSVIVYFLASSWMFIIGMAAAIYTGAGDIAGIMQAAGFGAVGLLIVVLSTVTTTFLDANSGGVSQASICDKINEKAAAVAVTVVGTLMAVCAPVEHLEDFLYLIGSVFAPMIAILVTDVYILKRDVHTKAVDARNAVLWVVGFAIYRWFMYVDTPLGNTLPVIVIVGLLCVAVELCARAFGKRTEK